MNKIKQLKQIYSRLASLEDDRECARLLDKDVTNIDKEIKSLRITLQELMNNKCPLVGVINEKSRN